MGMTASKFRVVPVGLQQAEMVESFSMESAEQRGGRHYLARRGEACHRQEEEKNRRRAGEEAGSL